MASKKQSQCHASSIDVCHSSVPWVEKYRPKTLLDVVAQRKVIDTLQALVSQDKLTHLILHGPPGTGKTSTALALAQQVAGKANTLELNASDDNGIVTVRDVIQRFATTTGLVQQHNNAQDGKNNNLKVIVLDEADSMSPEAQAALRGTIERYSTTCRFCFICNSINKISPAIRSRCKQLRFVRLDRSLVARKIVQVAQQEDLVLQDDALDAIMHTSNGDMRIALNTLQALNQQTTTNNNKQPICKAMVYACTACCDPTDILMLAEVLTSRLGFCTIYAQVQKKCLDKRVV